MTRACRLLLSVASILSVAKPSSCSKQTLRTNATCSLINQSSFQSSSQGAFASGCVSRFRASATLTPKEFGSPQNFRNKSSKREHTSWSCLRRENSCKYLNLFLRLDLKSEFRPGGIPCRNLGFTSRSYFSSGIY